MALTDPTTIFTTSLGYVYKGVNRICQDTDILMSYIAGIQKQKLGGEVIPMIGIPDDVKISVDEEGRDKWYWAKRLQNKYNQTFRGLNIRDTLDDPTDEGVKQIKLSMKTSAMPIEVEWEVAKSSGAGSLVEGGSIWEDRSASIDMIWPLRMGSVFRGDGTGTLAVARVTSSSSKTLYVYDTADLHVASGMYVDVIDGSGVEQLGDCIIDSVDYVNHIVTFTATKSITAGWRLVIANSYNKFAPGLGAYISDGSPIGSTTVGQHYSQLGNTTWGGLSNATMPEHTSLIWRANNDGDGDAGTLRHWDAKKLEALMQLRNDSYGSWMPITHLWMRPDLYNYMREHAEDKFYKAVDSVNITASDAKQYTFGVQGPPVYKHPALGANGSGVAPIIVDPKAWSHCVVGLAMYPDTIGIRWAKPPHFVTDTDSQQIAIQNQVNYNGKFVYRGTMACLWAPVGAWRNRFWVYADAYGARNEPWNRPS